MIKLREKKFSLQIKCKKKKMYDFLSLSQSSYYVNIQIHKTALNGQKHL